MGLAMEAHSNRLRSGQDSCVTMDREEWQRQVDGLGARFKCFKADLLTEAMTFLAVGALFCWIAAGFSRILR